MKLILMGKLTPDYASESVVVRRATDRAPGDSEYFEETVMDEAMDSDELPGWRR
jgi:hypothetical protein